MIKSNFNFKENNVIIYSKKSVNICGNKIREEISKSDIYNLHSYLLNNINDGWYAVVYFNNKKYLLNDFKGSYRLYINLKLKEWSLNFWEIFDFDINEKNVNEVLERGYTTGFKTISNNIQKLLPSSIFDFQLNIQKINHEGLFKEPVVSDTLFDYRYLKNKKIGIAFSGGLDSTFLASSLIKLGLNPKLYFFVTDIDDEKDISILQAKDIAKKLGLKLKLIEIKNTEIIDFFPECFDQYPNDISYAILAIKLFVKKIENEIDILITGQNSDTFIAYGLSRAYHPIESLSRLLYKIQYKKIYNEIKLNFIDKIILKVTYKLRNQDLNHIPKNKKELIFGWSNEKFYLSRYLSEFNDCSILEFYENLNYNQALLVNKLINHISGNHSLVWSDIKNVDILMPLGNKIFIEFCKNQHDSWKHVFNPKRILEKDLIINFSRKKHPILNRLKSFFGFRLNTISLDFNFKESYRSLLDKKIKFK